MHAKKLHRALSLYKSQYLPEDLLRAPEYSEALERFFAAASQSLNSLEADRNFLERSTRINVLLHAKDPTPSVLSKVAAEISAAIGLPIVILFALDPRGGVYRVMGQSGANDWAKAIKSRVYNHEEIFRGSDIEAYFTNDTAAVPGPAALMSMPVESFVLAPMRIDKTPYGVVFAGHPRAGACSLEMLSWLDGLASQLAAELERRRLNEISEEQKTAILMASKMSEIGKMAGGVAHEINTPLSSIMLLAGNIRMMLERGETGAIGEAVDKIERTAKRIGTIVKGLRTFSRDGSRDPIAPANLAQIVRETVSLCGERLRNSNVTLTVDVAEDLTVACRETQISQLLLNLLNNSFDAILPLAERWIRIDARESETSIEISVTDAGPGIPPEIREKLALPFFTTKPIGQGTGLGLSISMGIAQDHGGRLEVDADSPNTRFVLSLPKNL